MCGGRVVLNAILVLNTFHSSNFDFIIEPYSVLLSMIAIFFLIWTLATFLSYYPIVWWLVSGIMRHRILTLSLAQVILWLAFGCRSLEAFLGSTSDETRRISWMAVGFLILPISALLHVLFYLSMYVMRL